MSNKTIHELDNLSEIAQNDEMLVYDISAGADNPTKKTTVGTIKDFMANNIKDVYSTDEVKTNKVWIDGKPIYRKYISLGNLPNNGTKDVAHNISNIDVQNIVKLDGFFTNGSSMFQLPYRDTGASTVFLIVNATNIIVTDNFDLSAFSAYITVEYTKTTD